MANQRTGIPGPVTNKGLLSTTVDDASMQAAIQPWIGMEFYQLSRGKQVAQVDILDLGSQQIVRESQQASVQKLGATPSDLCTVSYCTQDPTFRFSDHIAGDTDTIFFMPENTEFDIFVPAGVQTTYVSFSQKSFLEGVRTLNPSDWDRAPQKVLSIHAAHKNALREIIDPRLTLADTSAAPDASPDMSTMYGLILQTALQLATATRPDDLKPSPMERSRAFHICRMARTFVEDSLAVNVVPTIVDICRCVGTSERNLQYAFRAYVDMSPLAYLRLCRLNRVRAILRASDPQTTTVTSVAMQFGFLHLGRFSLDYKRVFDESPSATLAS